MKLLLHLSWCERISSPSRAFKQPAAFHLLSEYLERILPYARYEIAGPCALHRKAVPGSKLVLCDKNHSARTVSSEQLAAYLSRLQSDGTRELHVVIGGADGFTAAEVKAMKPDLIWSFGPLTLPHELASVVAAEQLYRAYSIIHHLPYHRGHA